MLILYAILQTIVVLFLALHDWVHLPPFTDIRALEKHHSKKERLRDSLINTSLVLIPYIGTLSNLPGPLPRWVIIAAVAVYTLMTCGTLFAWWIPYFFGSSEAHKAGFKEYESTHRFLPARGDNVIPNTMHVVMHLFIWSCCILSWYLLLKG